ncbi:MAG: hypothetical protein NTU44_15230 [Bacteroidetes bacterium]|nr:hypothetical protein [Bacteroidota bacterium]
MKRFILKLTVFTFIAAAMYVVVLVGLSLRYAGYLDNYSRIIREHDGSLIFGSSRASVGINPEPLNRPGTAWLPFYNFSGTAYHTPYGPAYLKLIQRKFSRQVPDRRRVYLLAVDPWSVGCELGKDNPRFFSENTTFTNKLWYVHSAINLDYLIRFTYYPVRGIIGALLFNNLGWLDENGKFEYPVTLEECLIRHPSRFAEALAMHKQTVMENRIRISTLRMYYLNKTIDYLTPKGDVVLVRLPVTDEMLALENRFAPDFSLRLKLMARQYNCQFLDYSHDNKGLVFIDDHHLYNTSAVTFSELLCKDLTHLLADQLLQ